MRGHMQRREFFIVLGGAVAWPLAARAQHATPVVGFLNGASDDSYARFVREFRRGLNSMGFSQGQKNVVVEYHWAQGHYDRLPEMATDLVRRNVSVIVANTPAALAAKATTTKIPIVFTTASDPVSLGLVSSMAKPGGNVTGATQLNVELGAKRFELMRQLLPQASTVAVLINPSNQHVAPVQIKDAQEAARALGLQLQILEASTVADFAKAVAGLPKQTGLILGAGDAFFASEAAEFAGIAVRHGVPAISSGREFAAAGGLLSYGGSVADTYLLAGVYTGRILTGEKAGDIPVYRSSKVEMFINLKTAKALGIKVPQGMVIAADEVFED